ncbi:MAG: hypothetical protein EBR09_07095 [Proteobacteria bacterium]|nr:hypothetical protein [Pseudomonadota bacterium]
MIDSGRNPQSPSGQALTEFIVVLPLIFILIPAAESLYTLLSSRIVAESSRMENRQSDFRNREEERMITLRSYSCEPLAASYQPAGITELPENVEAQRALTMAALRFSCLAEGTSRLGPKAAAVLWALYLEAPSEKVGQSLSLTLCPKTKLSSERVRLSIRTTFALREAGALLIRAKLAKLRADACRNPSISLPMLDRFDRAILDR